MTLASSDPHIKINETEAILTKAKLKVRAINVAGISSYLPDKDGYRMHHNRVLKLKREKPSQLIALLEKYILEPENPKQLERKPRTSKKSKNTKAIELNSEDLVILLSLAKQTENESLVERLQSYLPLSVLKKEMHKCIREERVDFELWNSYVNAIQSKD